MKTLIDNLIEEIENQTDEVCDHCGEPYDSNSEGHEHFEDGSCECKYCINGGWKLKGLKFCSPECEMNYIYEDDKSA